MTRPPKKQKARPLAQLRADWKKSAIDTSGVAVDIIESLLEHARAAARAIRAGSPPWSTSPWRPSTSPPSCS
ncbi:hypothetical protein [Streptomyces sp. NBC_01320]|uniref:hypothetical protein n=1 Tax=Streptomyces sp. NBC_01320 TaxID=2903824 RepID=UPI002E10EC81|nr:hypothetical protein OG395_08070 [Streptomyces sp. NBC_01320]